MSKYYGIAKVPGTEPSLNKVNMMEVLTHTIICGKEFDVYGTAENPLFKAADIAEMIEHSNTSKMIKDAELDETECVSATLGTLTNSYTALMLTEDGLYEVLMQSRKPIAKQFKKGVKKLLKDIRLQDRQPMTMLEALKMALAAEEKRLALEARVGELVDTVNEFRPKVDNYNQFLSIDDSITVSCVAKKFGLSATKLNRILKEEGVQYKPKGRSFWLPKQGYEDWFMVKDVKYDGDTRLTSQTRVSPLGEEKIKEILVRLGYHEQMLLPF